MVPNLYIFRKETMSTWCSILANLMKNFYFKVLVNKHVLINNASSGTRKAFLRMSTLNVNLGSWRIEVFSSKGTSVGAISIWATKQKHNQIGSSTFQITSIRLKW